MAIVKADEGDLVGHPQPILTHDGVEAEHHEIVGDQDSIWPIRHVQQAPAQVAAAALGVVSLSHRLLAHGDIMLLTFNILNCVGASKIRHEIRSQAAWRRRSVSDRALRFASARCRTFCWGVGTGLRVWP